MRVFLAFIALLVAMDSIHATPGRYHHLPEALRGQAYEFETAWNTHKGLIPEDNVLRTYVQDVLDKDIRDKDLSSLVNNPDLPPLDEDGRMVLRGSFWHHPVRELMKREGNALSCYFLGKFAQLGVCPMEGDFDPLALLRTSGEGYYPRANAALLTPDTIPALERPPTQDRYDHVVNPQRFISEYVRVHPDPASITVEAVAELLEVNTPYLPGIPQMYKDTHVDLKYMLAENLRGYRPPLIISRAFGTAGAIGGFAMSLIDAWDKFADPFSVTSTSGNATVITKVDPVPTQTVGFVQLLGLGVGVTCGFVAATLVEGRMCGYTLPRDMPDDLILSHSGMIAAYLTLKEKNNLWELPDREARREFWRMRISRYAREVANNFYLHSHTKCVGCRRPREEPAYGLSGILVDDVDALVRP